MSGTMLVTRKKKIQFWAMHRQVELGTVDLELGRIVSGTGL
jgi:hypothetical protein